MRKLSKEQCKAIRDCVEFQIMVAQATSTSSLSIPAKYGLAFMFLLDEKLSQETCPYCHEDRDGYVSANGAFFLHLDSHEGWLLYAGKSKCKPRPVKYCPMCGRKLLTIQEELSNE